MTQLNNAYANMETYSFTRYLPATICEKAI